MWTTITSEAWRHCPGKPQINALGVKAPQEFNLANLEISIWCICKHGFLINKSKQVQSIIWTTTSNYKASVMAWLAVWPLRLSPTTVRQTTFSAWPHMLRLYRGELHSSPMAFQGRDPVLPFRAWYFSTAWPTHSCALGMLPTPLAFMSTVWPAQGHWQGGEMSSDLSVCSWKCRWGCKSAEPVWDVVQLVEGRKL